MAALLRLAVDTISKVQPLFEKDSYTPAEKDEAKGLLKHLMQELGKTALCAQLLDIKENVQKMLSLLDSVQCRPAEVERFKAPRPTTGMFCYIYCV